MEQPVISSDLIRGHIDTIILHSLLSGDMFPQLISDFIEQKSENSYQINQATLYSSLKRLESLGHVRSYWHDSESGRRKFFKITDKGAEIVKENLSSWSYSRSILDKMMDCEQQPIVKTEYVVKEVVVEKPVEVTKIVEKVVAPTSQSALKQLLEKNDNEQVDVNEQNQPKLQETIQNNNYTAYKQDEKEGNFRNILSGLIKISDIAKSEGEKLVPLEKTGVNADKIEQKQSFNEMIENDDYVPHKMKFNGKIDFSDLVSKASGEGYKLRVSSNEPINTGKIFENKLNFLTAICIFMLCAIETLFISIKYGNQLNMPVALLVFACASSIAIPAIFGYIYYKNPNKTTAKASGDGILISSIVAFNLLLITFAVNLISNVNFSDLSIIMYSIILPVIILVDVVLFFVARYYLSKLKFLKLK